jgi:hypothetical protein
MTRLDAGSRSVEPMNVSVLDVLGYRIVLQTEDGRRRPLSERQTSANGGSRDRNPGPAT